MSLANFPVVLDACVLYPRALRDTLLRAAERRLYRPHWLTDILDEVERNLIKNRMFSASQATYLRTEMTRAFPDAVVVGFESLVPRMTNDEKDRHVVAAAVLARAELIVTANIKDFPPDALDPYGMAAKTPDEFLLDLMSLDGRTMTQVVREQFTAISASIPNSRIEMLYEALTRHAPNFVDVVRVVIDALDDG